MSQELVDSVNELTNETTKLLGMYTDSKVTIDEKVAKASSSAATATVKAAEAKESAAQSQDSYNKAYIEADRSKTEADRSQTAADRAELVSGMDTAQQLVDVAVTEGFVPVQAQIDAVQANTKLPIVHAPLDNKLSLHAGIGDPVFVKSSDKTITVPAQDITVGAETVTIPAQEVVVASESIEVPDIQQIKFSRASSAWLDGKEYAADEPRYTADGKLLVEPQATNEFPKSNFVGWRSPPQTRVENGITVGYASSSMVSGIGPSEESIIATCFVRLLNADKTPVSTPLECRTVSWDSIIPIGGDWQRIVYTDNSWGGGGIEFYTPANSNNAYILEVKELQINNPDTSYIPTSGTAVTRAADIATINGQNIVTRWENDQQPLDTDTPNLLANGEHDMSADRLVKFERSTSAWLDGKEYAADEPRYTADGKLLVEPQATNEFPKSNFVGWRTPPQTRVENGITVGYASSSMVSGIRPSGESIIATCFVRLLNADKTPVSTPLECITMSWSHSTFIGGDWQRIVYTDNSWGGGGIEFYTPANSNNAYILEVKELQINNPDTSYIPTSGTAVTRAAEYAHVISKAAINTPTGLLPTGEHSVEPTAIRSFKRDTSAWLDGVEYPANTPRYLENGKLLIEGQSTNHFYRSESVGSGGESINCIDHIISIEGVSTPAVKLTPVADAYTFTRLHLPLERGKIYDISCFVHTDTVQSTPPVLFSGSYGGFHKPFVITEIVAGTLWKYEIKELELFGNSGFGWSPSHVATAVECHVTQMMFILSSEPTTNYIPTSGTAVTRTADECFVDYQLPPNTYRDLKGFKK